MDYFSDCPPDDAAWALYFLTGRRLKSLVKSKSLRQWVADVTGYPDWLVASSYEHVGDLGETIALLLPEPETTATAPTLEVMMDTYVLPLRDWAEPMQRPILLEAWSRLNRDERLVYHKLLTGGFRVGVSRSLVVRALAQLAGIEPAVMDHRLSGNWQPQAEFFQAILSPEDRPEDRRSRPYPFFLASPLEQAVEQLGSATEWHAEWKWDGIRAQLIKRGGDVILWSRGQETLTESFPEVQLAAAHLPDGVVLDGEILCWHDGSPLPFARLQKRITRKRLTREILSDNPAVFLAYDCLETDGVDIREHPIESRLERLRAIIREQKTQALRIAEPVVADTWEQLAQLREQSRQRGVEGLMLKREGSPYGTGRQRGNWFKWKIDPMQADAVLVYAQAGHGRRAGLFTDYTFAVWQESELVPFAKAYSGLTDEEILSLDNWIKRNTTGRHGPLHIVKPEQVFELHFEGISESTTHKSGLATRFPRIHRWRKDKPASEADTTDTLRALLPK